MKKFTKKIAVHINPKLAEDFQYKTDAVVIAESETSLIYLDTGMAAEVESAGLLNWLEAQDFTVDNVLDMLWDRVCDTDLEDIHEEFIVISKNEAGNWETCNSDPLTLTVLD